jgi:hypothetical protein
VSDVGCGSLSRILGDFLMTIQSVLFEGILSKPVQVEFSDERLSSDAGSILLVAADKKVELLEAIAAEISDDRDPEKTTHEITEILKQRVYSIANGYADGNDAAKMRGDPVLKVACGRMPIEGEDLASQPTISRFENAVGPRELLGISKTIARKVLSYQKSRRKGKRKPKVITIDMDPYCSPTYGGQQQTFFSGFYDTYCYLPQVVTLCFDDETIQYAVGAILRPGNKGAQYAVIPILKRLLPLIQKAFPEARIRFRADSNFSGPELLSYLEEEGLGYYVGIGENKALERYAEDTIEDAEALYKLLGRTVTRYGEASYQAGTWHRERRVVFKAEVLEAEGKDPKTNVRYLVTNLQYAPRNTFKKYHLRGDMENRIKELKCDLTIDRTSCTSFLANQFRVLMTLAAFVLYQILQDRIADGELAKAQVCTLRDKLFKIAARVKETARRVVICFTVNYPWGEEWILAARAFGGVT